MALVGNGVMLQMVALCFDSPKLLTEFGISFWSFGSTFSVESLVCVLFLDIFMFNVFLSGAGVFNKTCLVSDTNVKNSTVAKSSD